MELLYNSDEEQKNVITKTEPRKEWEKAFEEMHKFGDDKALLIDIFEDENLEELI